MLKRMLAAEPVAPAAEWSRRSASFALVLAVFGILLARSGVVGGWAGVAVLAVALAVAVAALGFAVRAAVVIWQKGWRGTGRALGGFVLALLILAYPSYLASRAMRLPWLNDVSTDLVAPPPFSASASARAARGGFAHADASAQIRDAQRRAYPGVQPTMLDLDPDAAYKLVLQTVQARRWRIVEASPPKGRFGVGHIDAITTSRIMGLPADLAIRVRPEGGQTRVDIRSASRLEQTDLGTNAARIESFMDDLQNAE